MKKCIYCKELYDTLFEVIEHEKNTKVACPTSPCYQHEVYEVVLTPENIALVTNDILATFETEELSAFKSFNDFFWEVDVQNAFEEEWPKKKDYWKPYYKHFWNKYILKKEDDHVGEGIKTQFNDNSTSANIS